MKSKERKTYRPRRAWTQAEKTEILRYAYEFGTTAAVSKYDVVSSLIYVWKRQFKKAQISINTDSIQPTYKTKRRQFSLEQKKEILRESFQLGTNRVCAKYNIHPTLIYKWRNKLAIRHKDFVKKGMSINCDKDLKLRLNDNLILEEPVITKEYVENNANPLRAEFSKLFKQLGEDYSDFKDIQRITNDELRMEIKHWRKFTDIAYWMSALSFLAACALSAWVYYLMGQIK